MIGEVFYGTEDSYGEYNEAMGYEAVDGDVPTALTRASVYIDANWGARFPGVKTGGRTQVRMWPRSGATDIEGLTIPDDEEPVEVQNATYEAARRELITPGVLQPDVTQSSILKRVKVEGAIEVEYANTEGFQQGVDISILNGILAPILTGAGGSGSGLFGTSYRI